MSNKTLTQCVLSHCTSTKPPTAKMTPAHFLPHSKWLRLFSAIIRYCKQRQWSVFFSPCQRVLISSECQGCLPGSTSFLSEPNPFLVLCNIVHHCPSALINILHAQHLWSVFHCSSSGETSVAALQMDIGASPETIRFPHTTSLTCVLKTPDLDHLRLERKLPEHKAGALVYTLKHIIALLSLQVEGLL